MWIRRRKTPVTPEQSAMLTEFGMRQVGKRFALIRLGGQLTPLRSRGPLRTYFIGKPHGDRDSYFCSELVTETLVAGGLLDRATTRPAATYPHDLFFEKSWNPYLREHLHLECDWYPPARWCCKPCLRPSFEREWIQSAASGQFNKKRDVPRRISRLILESMDNLAPKARSLFQPIKRDSRNDSDRVCLVY